MEVVSTETRLYVRLKRLPPPQIELGTDRSANEINRIFHRFMVQTEKSQPRGERIMPETKFTEFPALSIDPRVGISQPASETNV